ncbi:MAG: hypothetical protein H8E37_07515 [Planctomycetes bacterium]|nr:hypothetical protein [Planctomycetota bacterium]
MSDDELPPGTIRLHQDDSNLVEEAAAFRAFAAELGLEEFIRLILRLSIGKANRQTTWLTVRSMFDIPFGDFAETFDRVLNEPQTARTRE